MFLQELPLQVCLVYALLLPCYPPIYVCSLPAQRYIFITGFSLVLGSPSVYLGKEVCVRSNKKTPKHILVTGRSGAGKSTFARRLSRELKIPHIEADEDQEMKELF